MKQTRFTEAQIVGILQEADAQGAGVREVCNRHGVWEQTFYRWLGRYANLGFPVQSVRACKDGGKASGDPRSR
jgi:transposase-like protein